MINHQILINHSLACLHWNVQSINNKCHDVLSYLCDNNVDIVFLSESWLYDANNSVTSLIREQYLLFHSFRESRGGGVAILIKPNIPCRPLWTNLHLESMEIVSVILSGGTPLCICCIYRKQEVSFGTFLAEIAEVILSLLHEDTPFLLCGDFNIHINITSDSKSRQISDLADEFGVKIITSPGHTHKYGNILDFIICDSLLSPLLSCPMVDYDQCSTQTNKQSSDHYSVLFNILFHNVDRIDLLKYKDLVPVRAIHKVDFDIFRSDVSFHLSQIDNINSTTSFNDLLLSFNLTLSKVLNDHTPLKMSKIKHSERPRWMDHEYVSARALKRKYEKRFKKSRNFDDKIKFTTQSKLCASLADNKRTSYYKKAIAGRFGDQRALFSFVRQLLDSNPVETLPNGSKSVIANDLNSFFVNKIEKIHYSISNDSQIDILDFNSFDDLSVCNVNVSCDVPRNHDNDSNVNYINYSHVINSIEISHVNNNSHVNNLNTTNTSNEFNNSRLLTNFEPCTQDELADIIKSSKINTSPNDPLPSCALKECLDEILPYLTVIVNSSLKHGSMDGTKEAIIRPLLKKANLDYNAFANFRPISNLSFISKVIERVVLKRLDKHMTVNNLHTDTQFGYKKYHSTETLLVHFLDETLVAVDQHLNVVVLIIGLSAAFDTVNHDILIKILKDEIRVRGTALQWFRSSCRVGLNVLKQVILYLNHF